MAKAWLEPLHWENEGSEPNEILKKNGFRAGDKPPADLFNYFLSQGEKCIKELQKEKIDVSNTATNSSVALVKNVIENSAQYAKIKEIGGITRKCTNLWNNNPVSARMDGVDIWQDVDGGIILDGYCEQSNNFIYPITLKAGTYYLSDSAIGEFPSDTNRRIDIVGDGISIGTDNMSPSNFVDSATITEEVTASCRIRLQEGHTYNNCKLYPMLSYGEPLPFEPYFEGLRTSPVTEIRSVGTNLFDVSQITTRSGITNNGDGTISVTGYGISTGKTLKQLCPELKIGDVATLKMVTDGMKFIYLYQYGNVWDVGASITITETHLDSTVHLYCNSNSGVYSKATISNITVTVGKNTEYTPYLNETLYIPEFLQGLDGYGEGIDADYCNKIVFGNNSDFKKYRKYVDTVELSALEWNGNYSGDGTYWWNATLANCKAPSVNTEIGKFIAEKYNERAAAGMSTSLAGEIALDVGGILRVNTGNNSVRPTGKVVYVLNNPVETDISDVPIDGYIKVASNGTITMVNEYGYDVPSVIEFYSDNHKCIAADNFIGNLKGTAEKALHSEESNAAGALLLDWKEAWIEEGLTSDVKIPITLETGKTYIFKLNDLLTTLSFIITVEQKPISISSSTLHMYVVLGDETKWESEQITAVYNNADAEGSTVAYSYLQFLCENSIGIASVYYAKLN